MKKKIILGIICLLILSGIGFGIYWFFFHNSEDLSSVITEKTSAYRTDLKDASSTFTNNQKVEDYLTNWAKSRGVGCETDDYGNVIMSVKSSTDYKVAPPTVIICNYDAQQFNNCIDPMAIAMYIAKNNEDTGELHVIFTSSTSNDFSGIQNLSDEYFTNNTNVFCLNGGKKAMFSTMTGGMSVYTQTRSLEYTSPVGTKAIKISISNLPGGTPDGKINSYPNPIKTLTDLLAYFKTNAYIYELADISGGTGAGVYPTSAEMTVVVSDDMLEKITSKLDSEIESFNKNNKKDYPNATYAYSLTELPEQVFTETSNNDLVSLMYTLNDGVYFRDDDDNLISIMNIGAVRLSDSTITISSMANSLSKDNLTEIDNNQNTISGLSNGYYEKISEIGIWKSKTDSQFAQDVAEAFNEYSGKDMEYANQITTTCANYVYQKNKKCNIMNISLYDEKVERYTGTIITFMTNLTHAE